MRKKIGAMHNMLRWVISLLLILIWAWGCLALFFSGPGPEWLKISLACLFACSLPIVFLFTRSFGKGLVLCLCLLVAMFTWWQTIKPTNDKDWAAEVARISHGEIQGKRLIIHNVRNFSYTGEQINDERWDTREYDLTKLRGLDIFLSYWASEHIAHTILSWDFGEDQHLAISIETRKDKTQEYSAIKGFFKQFELSYVAADEKDIIKLRTNYRKERVYVYPVNVTKQTALALLKSYLAEMNRLVNKPEFYDALTRNCTTTIHLHTRAIDPGNPPPMDWRLIASGHIDELLYERKLVAHDLPFAELRQKSRIDQRMQNYNRDNFSRFLRLDLPKQHNKN